MLTPTPTSQGHVAAVMRWVAPPPPPPATPAACCTEYTARTTTRRVCCLNPVKSCVGWVMSVELQKLLFGNSKRLVPSPHVAPTSAKPCLPPPKKRSSVRLVTSSGGRTSPWTTRKSERPSSILR